MLLFFYLAARAFVGGGSLDATFACVSHAPLAEQLAADDEGQKSEAGSG